MNEKTNKAGATSGQNVPKSHKSKFRHKSQQEQTAASKRRMEKRAEKLEKAKEKLAKQREALFFFVRRGLVNFQFGLMAEALTRLSVAQSAFHPLHLLNTRSQLHNKLTKISNNY